MNRWQATGQQQSLQIHERGDRQPSLDTRRTAHADGLPAALVIADEEIELDSDPQVQQQKRELKRAAQGLGMFRERALRELLARRGRIQ